MRLLLFILIAAVICPACQKDNVNETDQVEIYLLKTFQTVTGKCQVDAAASVLENIPTITNQDIISYSQTDYHFSLTDAAIQRIKSFKDFTPFAVTVDKQIIYYGFFKPGFSNSSCVNSITMDLDWTSGNQISLKLGYPGIVQGVTIDDQRNNQKLLTALKNQGKLK